MLAVASKREQCLDWEQISDGQRRRSIAHSLSAVAGSMRRRSPASGIDTLPTSCSSAYPFSGGIKILPGLGDRGIWYIR
jgi:hypothetical protein